MKKSYKKPEVCILNKETNQVIFTSEAYAAKSKVLMDAFENQDVEKEKQSGGKISGKF